MMHGLSVQLVCDLHIADYYAKHIARLDGDIFG